MPCAHWTNYVYKYIYILIRYAQPNIKNLYPNSGVGDNMDNFKARGLLPVNSKKGLNIGDDNPHETVIIQRQQKS